MLATDAGILGGAGRETSPHIGSWPIVEELKTLLEVKPDLAKALDEGIANAGIVGILSRDEYYAFLDALVTWVPTERDLVPKILKFYYVVDQAPEDVLNQDEQFNQWMVRFAQDWGSFLDTPESAKEIEGFLVNQPLGPAK